jgi:hypothetical protein
MRPKNEGFGVYHSYQILWRGTILRGNRVSTCCVSAKRNYHGTSQNSTKISFRVKKIYHGENVLGFSYESQPDMKVSLLSWGQVEWIEEE